MPASLSWRALALAYTWLVGLWLSVGAVLRADQPPWTVAAVTAVITFLLAGPLLWVTRERLAPVSEVTVKSVALVAGTALFALVALLALTNFVLTPLSQAIVLGTLLGMVWVLVVEVAVVPDRLCGFAVAQTDDRAHQSGTR